MAPLFSFLLLHGTENKIYRGTFIQIPRFRPPSTYTVEGQRDRQTERKRLYRCSNPTAGPSPYDLAATWYAHSSLVKKKTFLSPSLSFRLSD